ncbi:hypothetical protein [Saccharospirillum mangrovi]|uniref:PheS-related mystery ligase SrmL n=1 Tax=Saccharospirillum mangrovi TaxID=2161747 RepID=UPI000D3ADFE5|nr:hypothetical protein [Saccharospirillum mangrovi]
MNTQLTAEQLVAALSLRDLSNPAQGPHAIQLLLDAIQTHLTDTYQAPLQRLPASPLVPVTQNYDALGYPPDGPAREARYSRYLSDDWMLRTQTSALVPTWLQSWPDKTPRRLMLLTHGLVYRRDSIDRLHCAEPHQADIWILLPRSELIDEQRMVRTAIGELCQAILPDQAISLSRSPHPYTQDGLQLDALTAKGELVEIGECGRIDPGLLARTGWNPNDVTGIAIGLGLDRLLMVRKQLPDIRLLRNADPRVAEQMLDLEPWRPVSWQPAIERDLSIATDNATDAELLGDQVRQALTDQADWLEMVQVLSETPAHALPPQAVERLGLKSGQKNLLLRLVIRHPTRSITQAEANALRNRVYQSVHRGEVMHWAND